MPLRVALMDRVIGAAGCEQAERRISAHFRDAGCMQAGWEVMEICSQGHRDQSS